MITSSQRESLSKVAVLFAPEFYSYATLALCFILYVDKMKASFSFFPSEVDTEESLAQELKVEYHISKVKYSDC